MYPSVPTPNSVDCRVVGVTNHTPFPHLRDTMQCGQQGLEETQLDPMSKGIDVVLTLLPCKGVNLKEQMFTHKHTHACTCTHTHAHTQSTSGAEVCRGSVWSGLYLSQELAHKDMIEILKERMDLRAKTFLCQFE